MRILLSAYACAPNRGSEDGIGWQWACMAARLGYDVTVMTVTADRAAIERECAREPVFSRIAWHFLDVPRWDLPPGGRAQWERTHNLLWQVLARRLARRLQREAGFDLIHHLTWGGLRAPCFLHGLGPPLVIGPLGGGERTPPGLWRGLPRRARVAEWVRDATTATIGINPIVAPGLRAARTIVVKTSDTARALPRGMQARAVEYLELGLEARDIGPPRTGFPAAPHFLFAGRLLAWKGAHLALQAFARIRAAHADAVLTIAGDGRERGWLEAMAAELGLGGAARFTGAVPRDTLLGMYDTHTALLFPSLHDSSGNVVLESLARGLPVICLDNGGPARIITRACGVAVPVAGRDQAAVVAGLAAAGCALIEDPARLAAMSEAARARAAGFTLAPRVAAFYAGLAPGAPAHGEVPAAHGAFAPVS